MPAAHLSIEDEGPQGDAFQQMRGSEHNFPEFRADIKYYEVTDEIVSDLAVSCCLASPRLLGDWNWPRMT
jgi:hypothetical protein